MNNLSSSEEKKVGKPKPKKTISGGFDMSQEFLPKKKEIPSTKGMKMGVVGQHPCRTLIVGGPGSGKTYSTIFSLLNKDMYSNYFDEIYLFSSTGKSDDTFEQLGLPKECIFTENLVDEVQKKLDQFIKESEGKKKHELKKRLCIFEDITSERKLLKSETIKKMFTTSRHMGCSFYAIAHAYKVLPPACREACDRIVVFPLNDTESEKVAADWTPGSRSKRGFQNFMKQAWDYGKTVMKKPFLQISRVSQKVYLGYQSELELRF